MNDILNDVRDRIRPGTTHMDNVERTKRVIQKALDKHEIDADCVVGGSFAKGTHLRGDHDVDLFVRFDKDTYKTSALADHLENALPFEAERVHGSRDYFHAHRYKLDFEIVPVLAVDNHAEAKNVTDMSPLHVHYVKQHLDDDMADEIRLAKQFCKANKVYGAESYIRGFSGHVIDLLIIYYGNFKNLLNAATNWGKRVVIDQESHWSNPLRQLNDSKLESPLVLIDPLQPERNAAAALSRDKFHVFKARARDFLNNPDTTYFKITHFDADKLEDKASDDHLIFFEMAPYKNKDDVMGAKLRQAFDYIHRKVEDRQWPIIEADWEFLPDEQLGRFYFILDNDRRDYIEREGPRVTDEDNVKRFTDKHADTHIKGGRIYAHIDRRHTTPRELIEHITGLTYVQERVKQVRIIHET